MVNCHLLLAAKKSFISGALISQYSFDNNCFRMECLRSISLIASLIIFGTKHQLSRLSQAIAPAHITQGSTVTYKVHSFRYFPPRTLAAAVMAAFQHGQSRHSVFQSGYVHGQ